MKKFEDILKDYKAPLANVKWEELKNKTHYCSPDLYLFSRWAYKVGKGWYGFALETAPMAWAMIIDEFLTELEKEAPDFEIHQIKLKFGGVRFYVELNLKDAAQCKEIEEEIVVLESKLFNQGLIY